MGALVLECTHLHKFPREYKIMKCTVPRGSLSQLKYVTLMSSALGEFLAFTASPILDEGVLD